MLFLVSLTQNGTNKPAAKIKIKSHIYILFYRPVEAMELFKSYKLTMVHVTHLKNSIYYMEEQAIIIVITKSISQCNKVQYQV